MSLGKVIYAMARATLSLLLHVVNRLYIPIKCGQYFNKLITLNLCFVLYYYILQYQTNRLIWFELNEPNFKIVFAPGNL